MLIEMVRSKIHRAKVTDANLNYEGSISIDEKLLLASGIRNHQKVMVVNINNGNRFETYAISSKKPNEICLNGAAARLVCVGNIVIVMAFCLIDSNDSDQFESIFVNVDENNNIMKIENIKNCE